ETHYPPADHYNHLLDSRARISTRSVSIAESFLRIQANSGKERPAGRRERSLFTDRQTGKQSFAVGGAHRSIAKTTCHSDKSKMTQWRNVFCEIDYGPARQRWR